MAKAIWNGEVLAESETTQVVDGYTYFPPESIRWSLFKETAHETVCSTKGTASYYDVIAGGKTNGNSAWSYQEPTTMATKIRGWIGFWKGVRIEK